MIHESKPLEEVDLFRAVTIREIEERSELSCSDDIASLLSCIFSGYDSPGV